MKFTCTVDIQAPLDEVVKVWQNPNNLKHWQEGFKQIEHISGEPGTPGAKSRLLYDMRGRDMELIETIEVMDLPHEFRGNYDHKSMSNTMSSNFSTQDDGSTKWTAHFNYHKLNGFMIRMMAFLAPGMFKKQAQNWLDKFKEFVEAGPSDS